VSSKASRILTLFLCFCLALPLSVPMKASAAEGEVTITKVKQTPMVRADGTQETTASIVNGGDAFTGWAKVTVGSEPATIAPIGTIAAGASDVIVPVMDTNGLLEPGETTSMKLELYDNELAEGTAKAVYVNNEWARTRHWEFYLSQAMHTDLGYTNYQENLRKAYAGYLDTVKQYLTNSDERETDLEKFRYAMGDAAFVMGESYMKYRTVDQIEEMIELLKEGRLNLGAAEFNYTPENFSTEGAARAAYYTNRRMVDMLGVSPNSVEYFFDNPSVSKGYVDAAVKAGIKYGMHAMNTARSPYYKVRQFDIYYMLGADPNNKMLIFNGAKYSNDYGLGTDVNKAYTTLMNLINDLENRRGRGANPEFPYDKFAMSIVPFGDNQGPYEKHIIVANELNAKWHEDGKYIYPRIKTAFPQEFFEAVESEYGDLIPTEIGTEENWWNDGIGTTAYESGIAKESEKLIPVAETTASLASALQGTAYPYEDLAEAVHRSMLYNEHTWGASSYNGSSNYHDQFEWKRSNAFGAKALADKVLTDSLKQLSSQVHTEGQGIYVYNPLNWVRDDVVTVADVSELPEHFVIRDGAVSVPYTMKDGVLTFVANDVPALGYKTFTIESAAEAPSFAPQVVAGDHTIENAYYKVTFAADGTISSIIDKQNGNREIVDQSAPVSFNQYQYYDDFGIPLNNEGVEFSADKWKLYTPKANAGKLDIQANGYSAVASLNTSTFRASSIRQEVTLYNDIPRIDIRNVVVKESVPTLSSKEEAFYSFPFKTSGNNYEIRYDLPMGNTAEGEQVYGTSTDWYTANKWVNVKDKNDNYNMTLAIPNTSLLQFGERRTGSWSFDYRSEKSYIYSYVMNNMWGTNFQGDQPGKVDFKYSIFTNQGAGVGDNSRFGWETSTPLQATVITEAQGAAGAMSDNLINVSNRNVQLTTMKSAEANSDGMIVRFHEITGQAANGVTVTLPFAGVSSVTETDLIENDLSLVSSSNTFTFDLPAYGLKTFRVRFGAAPATVTNLTAESTESGSQTNLSLTANVTASSVFNDNYAPENARSIDNGLEWASKGQKTAWIQYDWDDEVTIRSIHIADRPNTTDDVVSAKLTFDDGSTYEAIGSLPADGKKQVFVLPAPKTTTSLKVEVVGSSGTANVGLLGVEAHSTDVVPAYNTQGTQLHWDAVDGALYYEVFRSSDPDFVPGSGNYLGTANRTVWFDTQVTGDTQKPYYYRVRAAGAGAKGAASIAVAPGESNILDSTPPVQPILGAELRSNARIDLYWTPVADDVMVQNYEVYRDGVKIGGMNDNHVISYRDRTVEAGKTYAYTVKAIDTSGNEAISNTVTIQTGNVGTALTGLEVSNGILSPSFNGETRDYTLKLGDNFARLEGISVTASVYEADPGVVITVNGVEVENGIASAPIPIHADGDTIVIRVEKDGATRTYEITASSNPPIIPAVGATAGSTYNASKTVLNLINNSGMSGNGSLQDVHRVDSSANDMWHTANNPAGNAWVEVDLGKVYPLDELWIWNLNQSGATNVKRGLRNVKIEYSTDNNDWQALTPPEDMVFLEAADPDYPFQLKQGTGLDAMSATNLNDGHSSPVRFNGEEARYVRITAHPTKGNGSWGDSYFGLAELRFTSQLKLADVVPVESIAISAGNGANAISVYGGSLQLSAMVAPAEATYQNVIWSVTDEAGNPTNSAVITESGKLIAARNGVVVAVASAVDNPAISAQYTVQITGQKSLLTPVIATAGSTYADTKNPQNLINGSGMSTMGTVFDVHDNHSSANTMWHTASYPGENAWVEFDFGAVSDIGEMWIWNMNQSTFANRGMKDVKIEYKVNQDDPWMELRGPGSANDKPYPYTLAKASGKANQAATNLDNGQPVIFHKQAQYVRITADPVVGQGTYGGEYYGLSEVRFTQNDEAASTGTISGTVTDSVYGAVSGASVSVSVYGVPYQAVTAEDGTYSIAYVPAGTGYTVTASKEGYASASVNDVSVLQDEVTPVNLVLVPNVIPDEDTYALTVMAGTGGSIILGASGDYEAGQVIPIFAQANSNYVFTGWVSTANGTFENAANAVTTFTMPANDTTIMALFASVPSGGSTGNIGGSPPAPAEPEYSAVINVKDASGNVTADTKLSITVDAKAGTAVLDTTSSSNLASNGGTSVITVPSIPDVNTYITDIPVAHLSAADRQGALMVSTDVGSITVPSNMLTGVQGTAGTKAAISIGHGDKSLLPEAARSAIGARPLIELSLSIDGKPVEWNNPGAPVTVVVPYTPTAAELANPERIVIWYIDGSGKATAVPNGLYDAATGTVTFSTTHFSYYAVGYNTFSFDDVAPSAWYNKAVSFVAAREITTGTGNGRYSPNAKLTRGDFLVMMMKAYGIAADEDRTDNFSDAGDTYYTGYLAAAKRLGIANGIGNNRFAPDRAITRQEMFTLLYHALKSIDKLPEGQSGTLIGSFSDAGQIASWATAAMTLFVETGTIGGSAGQLTPTSTTTRAEMAQVLYNLLSK